MRRSGGPGGRYSRPTDGCGGYLAVVVMVVFGGVAWDWMVALYGMARDVNRIHGAGEGQRDWRALLVMTGRRALRQAQHERVVNFHNFERPW